MGVKARKTGYQGMVRVTGHKPLYKTFKTHKEAKAWVRDQERRIDEGKITNPHIKIFDLIDKYEKEIAPLRKMADSHLAHDIPRIKRAFKDMRMSDLQGRGLIDWVRAQRTQGNNCHWHIARLRGVLRQAEHHWDVKVPWDDIKDAQARMMAAGTTRLADERNRRVSPAELEAIKAKLNPKTRQKWSDIFDFCIASAMRISEVGRITWADFDEVKRTVIIRDRKHPTKKFGNHWVVPLINGSFEIVQRQPRKKARIFPLGRLYASKIFHEAVVKAGIEDMVLHDLRHEGISRLFEMGFQIQEVAMVSGHTEWKTLARYTHLRPESLVSKEAALRELLQKSGHPKVPEVLA